MGNFSEQTWRNFWSRFGSNVPVTSALAGNKCHGNMCWQRRLCKRAFASLSHTRASSDGGTNVVHNCSDVDCELVLVNGVATFRSSVIPRSISNTLGRTYTTSASCGLRPLLNRKLMETHA